MRILAAVLAASLVAACSRSAPAPGGAVLEYAAPDGSFTSRLPGGWKVDDAPGVNRKAAFFGPPDGAKPFSQLIAVSFYPASGRYKDAGEYLAAQAALGRAEPAREVSAGGGKATEMILRAKFTDPHSGVQPLVTRVVAVPADGGFFALEHTWPDGETPSAAFDGVLAAFKPGEPK
jgi:hypothetical protein